MGASCVFQKLKEECSEHTRLEYNEEQLVAFFSVTTDRVLDLKTACVMCSHITLRY